MARRIILDSNYFLGMSEGALRHLCANGLHVSVSIIALEEALAQCHRGGGEWSIDRLRTRITKLTPFLDAAHPVIPVGDPLFYALGASFGGTADARYASYNLGLGLRWCALTDAADDMTWRHLAGPFNESIDRTEAMLSREVRGLRELQLEAVSDTQLRGRVLGDLSRSVSLRHGAQERLHAFGSCLSDKIGRARGEDPAKNDSEDVQLLQHLADDVILLTRDFKLIQSIDRTDSFQAPYVRTLGELLTSDLPLGPPWGRAARRAVRGHVRLQRSALAALEEEVSVKLRVALPPSSLRNPPDHATC